MFAEFGLPIFLRVILLSLNQSVTNLSEKSSESPKQPSGEQIMKPSLRGTMLAITMAVVVSSVPAITEAKEKKPLLSGASTEMIAYTCAGCHGPMGASTGPSIPTLGGMSSDYLVDMMEGYKTGEIPSTIMHRLAKGYTSKEIEQMGDYFSKQEYVAVKQKSNPSLVAKGAKLHDKYCDKCHKEGGTSADDDSGFLMGQWRAYLTAQLMDFQNKDRKAVKKMKKKLKKLNKDHGPNGVKALIEYYSNN